MPTAAIGLGANLPSVAGAPEATLVAAIAKVAEHGRVIARSSLYRTAPVGYLEQPSFVNAALLLETQLTPLARLSALLATERYFGRYRRQGPPKGPRTLDLDLLLFAEDDRDVLSHDNVLTLPHPAMHERAFVLAPLAEIAPGWRHPLTGRTIAELLAAQDAAGVHRISG